MFWFDVVRDGRRVRVVEASIHSADVEVARATALLLRAGPHPAGAPWHAPDWDAPLPDTLAPADGDANGGWDIRSLTPGGFWTAERKRLWARDRWQLVAGEASSPAVRAALAADLPNPLANSSVDGLQFINADLTLFLARQPRSEWIGVEVADHIGRDGIAIGSCTLYDPWGAIGWASVCAITNTATFASDARSLSRMRADEIPVAHTPPGGYGDAFPAPVLAACTEPLVAGAPDLRGVWKTLRAMRGGEPAPEGDRIYSYTERIEQCGNRIVDMGGGTIADARADGTEENGVHDVSAFDYTTPVHVVASYEDEVFVLRPVGIRGIEVTRRLDPEGHMIWTRPDLGGLVVTLERVADVPRAV